MKETYVLIHGSWLGAWCWNQVTPLLEANGHKVIALDLPGHGKSKLPIKGQNIHSYADYIVSVLEEQEEPVILVAHSMGGMSVSHAACIMPKKIKKLVYLAAFLPKDGQSLNDIQPTDWHGLADAGIGITLSEDRELMLMKDDFSIPALYNDISYEDALEYTKLHGWETIEAPNQPVRITDVFETIPKYYVKCLNDTILLPEFQNKMISETHCDKIFEVESGHSLYFSVPNEVVDILSQLAD